MNDLIPPKEMDFVGGSGFQEVGQAFMRHFKEIGKLQPHERVLDVGCGIGRLAIPLTEYLNEQGSYDGFDIVPMGIKWCQEKITPRFPNFRFQLADICNGGYNPKGRYSAATYRFPYDDHSFDFVFLTSIFTHLLPADMENYLAEIARVLKIGGRAMITFFLLNDESKSLIQSGKTQFGFAHQNGVYYYNDPNNVEGCIGYSEAFVKELFACYGMPIDTLHYGCWCGREKFLDGQDIVYTVKRQDVMPRLRLRWQRAWHSLHPKYLWRRAIRRNQLPDIDPHTKKYFLPNSA